jgi:hypothetical protein
MNLAQISGNGNEGTQDTQPNTGPGDLFADDQTEIVKIANGFESFQQGNKLVTDQQVHAVGCQLNKKFNQSYGCAESICVVFQKRNKPSELVDYGESRHGHQAP